MQRQAKHWCDRLYRDFCRERRYTVVKRQGLLK